MLSERERRRLDEIEDGLHLTDPHLVRRFAALGSGPRTARRRGDVRVLGAAGPHPAGVSAQTGRAWVRGGQSMHRAGPVPSVLLGLALVVLVIGALAVSVPIVVAGTVLVGISLFVAAGTAPHPRPGSG